MRRQPSVFADIRLSVQFEAKAKTAYGEVELKICEKNGIVYRYPEYESVKKLCEAAGVPFKVVYQAACEAEISE